MRKYEAISLIGEGSFGTVYKGKVLETNEIVALKIIVKRGREAKELKGLKRECEIQRTLNHPNIIRMLDSFETDDSIVVISEYVDRELSQILNQEGQLCEARVHQITCDLVSALFYLHSHRVLHRDLKPQNVLIDWNGVAKLCDFGFARSMGARTHVLTSFKGTPLYMAPEVINAKPYDYSADLWSLGCIIYELLVGAPPFCTSSLLQLAQLIQYENVKWPDFISPDCKNFLQGLLQKEPEKRFSWLEIREHPYLKGGHLIFETDDPDFNIKYPFTNELSASQSKAKEIQRKEILEEAANFYFNAQQVPFYVPSNMLNLPAKPKEQQLMLIGNDRVNSTKPSSCPSQSVSVFKSLTENPIFKKVLHSSLKRVNKSLDLPNEKLYTSLASDFEDLKVDKENQSNENPSNAEDERKAANENVEEKEIVEKANKTKGFKTSKAMFTLHSWDSAASVRPIENEEWLVFLQRNMEELMTGQLDCLRNHNLVSVVVAPLRNSNASSRVLEYVAKMLSLPFVVEGPSERDLENIKQVYLEIKLIPNLVYASKIVARNKGYNSEESNPSAPIGSEMLLRPVSELSSDELQALESIYVLLCYLVHSGKDFLIQFCDAAAILNAVSLLQQFLLLGRRKVRIVTDLLAILNLIIKDIPENADLVEQIVLGASSSGGTAFDLSRLLTHSSRTVRFRTCDLIKQLGLMKPRSLQTIFSPRLHQDLNDLLGDSSSSVRQAAEEALKEIKRFTAKVHS